MYTIKYNFGKVEKWAPAVSLLFEVASFGQKKNFSLLIFFFEKNKKKFQGVKRDPRVGDYRGIVKYTKVVLKY